MKVCISLAVAIFALVQVALGGVGDAGVSDSYGSFVSDGFSSVESTEGLLSAPEIGGPYQDRFSPEDLSLTTPVGENISPDVSLGFRQATPPSDLSMDVGGSESIPGGLGGTGSSYWPGSQTSSNRFYIQTSSGLTTVAGCTYEGHLPLWADVSQISNFYVYEWYPGQISPSVRWWGWFWPGFYKGWFSGDAAGWHVLCYYCNGWSNYIYIYVWPGYSSAELASDEISVTGSGTPASYTITPPDLSSEGVIPPEYGYTGSGTAIPTYCYPSGTSSTDYGYSSWTPAPGKAYPKSTVSICNEYYIQTWQRSLTTTAECRYGDWLPLWSKISSTGSYWSFEWYLCGTSYRNRPDIKSFGYKGSGWYPTWFHGDSYGWYVLCYYCNDWSNYIYIYVRPPY